MKLNNNFTQEEQQVIDKWRDSKLGIPVVLDEKCYLLNDNGNLTYEQCFGKTESNYFNQQKYFLATPIHIIKYYNYYLLENKGEEGEWYVGEKQMNGSIEFTKCCETLKDAFTSL